MTINNQQYIKDLLESVDKTVSCLESKLMNQGFDSLDEKKAFCKKLLRFRNIQMHLLGASRSEKISNTITIE